VIILSPSTIDISSFEGELLIFIDRSASDSASHRAISDNLGSDYLAIAEALADRGYIDRLYGGGYRLQAKGRQAAMEYRLLKKQSDKDHAQQERDKHILYQHAKKDAEDRIAQADMKEQESKKQDQAFQLKLHKSSIRHGWIQWAFGAIGSIVGFVLGALVEYRTDLISQILKYFHP
jgi:hypothetical protein